MKNSLDPSPALAPCWSSLCTPEDWTSVSPAVQEDAPVDCLIKTLFLVSVPIAFCLLWDTGKNKLTFWFRSIVLLSTMVDLLEVYKNYWQNKVGNDMEMMLSWPLFLSRWKLSLKESLWKWLKLLEEKQFDNCWVYLKCKSIYLLLKSGNLCSLVWCKCQCLCGILIQCKIICKTNWLLLHFI